MTRTISSRGCTYGLACVRSSSSNRMGVVVVVVVVVFVGAVIFGPLVVEVVLAVMLRV